MHWLRITGLVGFWAFVGGVLDLAFFRDVEFASQGLGLRYAAVSGWLWVAFCIPTSLVLALGVAGWVRRRAPEERDRRTAAAAQLAAIALPWSLVWMLHVQKSLPPGDPVHSWRGATASFGIVLVALALWAVGTALLGRWRLPGARAVGTTGVALVLATPLAFLGASCGTPATSRPNVLVISVDSLRSDVFDEYVEQHASPSLRRFVAGSRTHRNAYTTFSHSLPSHASLFTGLYPTHHGALVRRDTAHGVGSPLLPEADTIAHRMTEHGYETIAILANAWLGPPFGLERGFQTFVNYGVARRVGHFDPVFALSVSVFGPYVRYVDARFVRTSHPNTRLFLRWLATRDASRPFFAFLHYIEMHTPSDPPANHRKRFANGPYADLGGSRLQQMIQAGEVDAGDMPALRRHLRRLHLADLAQVDGFLGPVLDELLDGGWLDDTLVLLMSDHGENLYDKGGTYGKSHVYEPSAQIPFVLRVPGTREAGHSDELTSLVDVAPTLYGFVGLAVPPGLPGRDLVADPPRPATEWVLVQGFDVPNRGPASAVVFGDGYKWIRDGARRDEIYRVREDPFELGDLATSRRQPPTRRHHVESILTEMAGGARDSLSVDELPDDAVRQLRALGYLE